jgi:hypothetical protein
MPNKQMQLIDDGEALTVEELQTLKSIARWYSVGKLGAAFIVGLVSLGFGIMQIIVYFKEHIK